MWRQLHLALALIAGLWFALLGVTGSFLVFHKEIDVLLNPNLLTRQDSGSDVPIAAAVAAVVEQIGPVLRADAPTGLRGVYRLQARDRSAAGQPLEVFVDPGSGRILGTRPWRRDLVAVIYDLHYTLLAGRFGRDVVGFIGIALIVSLGSGLYLWWPKGWAFRRSLRVKRRAPAARRIYDIHKTVGLPAAMLLGVSAFSGVTMQFPETTRALVQSLLPMAAPRTIAAGSSDASPRAPGLEHAIGEALAIIPDGRVTRVLMPDANAAYRVYLRRPGETLRSSGLNVVSLDMQSGGAPRAKIAQHYRAGDWFVAWQFPLHNGEAFGLIGRCIVAVSGLVPLVLYFTGLTLWWIRRKARKQAGAGGRAAFSSAGPKACTLS